jgi:hypothetical protein
MTNAEAIAVLESLRRGVEPPHGACEALDLAIATMRRKDPAALVTALAELDHALMLARPGDGRRHVSEEPEVIREYHQRWATEIVEFLQAFGRDPALDVHAYAARVRAGWRS